MKKILTLCLFLWIPFQISAQTLLNEAFSGIVPPSGWTIDAHATNWKSNGGSNAGGIAPECMFDYNPSFTGLSSLISPQINTTGKTSIKVLFKHSLDHYSGAYTIGAATRSGGGTWNTIWSKINPTGNVTEQVELTITNANVGASDFQICWFFNGNSFNLDYWYLDDILLYSPLAHDVTVKNILTLPEYAPGFNLSPQAVISNIGLNSETFNSTCIIKVGGNTLYNQTSSNITIPAGQDQTITFPDFILSVPNDIYEITVTTNLAGDMDPLNDTKSKIFDTYTTIREMVILEIGTGTWCQYCPGASMGAHDLLTNGKTVGVVKYHNGDTFTNDYSNARNSYYGISGYPTAFFDGVVSYVGGSNTQSMYSTYLPLYESRKSKNCAYTLEIFGTHTGANYNVQIRARKLAVVPPTYSNLVVHLALTESNIAFSWQGQTEVNNAERLMVPDQNGTALNFGSGNEVIINLSFAVNPSWVASNCELVSFIQNLNGKEILQGTKVGLPNLQPLPVELTSFTGSSSPQGVILNWVTASEINNHGFEIQKSFNSQDFHTVGFVSGFGTTTESKEYSFFDNSDYAGNPVIYYRLKQLDFNGNFEFSSIIEVTASVPYTFALNQNYPNPFNPSTKISYAIPERGIVNLVLYDMTGRQTAVLVNEVKEPGNYEVLFSAENLSSGVYFYKMTSGNFSAVKKLTVIK